MKKALKTLAIGLAGSKKFAALLAGLLVMLAVYPLTRWAGMDEAAAQSFAEPLALKVVALVSSYVIGQGIADIGKGARQVKDESWGVKPNA